MEILVISPTPTHPTTAGNRARIRSMLEDLRGMGHSIHFCYVAREGEEQVAEMRAAWDRVTVVPHNRKLEKATLPEGVFAVDDWIQPYLRGVLQYIASVETPDLVIAEYVFMSAALTYFPNSVKVIDTHDVFADRHLKLKELGLPPSFFYTTEQEERKGLSRADLVLAIQDKEAELLRRRCEANVMVLGYLPADFTGETQKAGETDKFRIGYLGSANAINVVAISAFLSALPVQDLAKLGYFIEIAGTICDHLPEQIKAQAEANGVRFLGPVEQSRAFFQSCAVVVNPHVGGTGLKIKTVEALEAGACVIGTTDAFEGLSSPSEWHDFADAASLARALPKLLQKPATLDGVRKASQEVFSAYESLTRRALDIFREKRLLLQSSAQGSLLVVTDIRFWQRNLGNEVRLFELLMAIPAQIKITVFVFVHISKKELDTISQIGMNIEMISFFDYKSNTPLGVLDPEKNGVLYPIEKKFFSREYFHSLENLLKSRSFDMVMIEYIRLSYLRHVKNFPNVKIIDTHDIMSMRVENFSYFGKSHFINIPSSEEFELLSTFDMVGCIQRHELALVNMILPGKGVFIPHVVKLPDVKTFPEKETAMKIGFVGGRSPMNTDGILWFLRQVWPLFANTGVELHIAGGVCDIIAEEVAAHHQPGVLLLGEIPDLTSFYQNIDIAINPVFYGGGVKIKSLEAMSYGVPLVASREAAFGLEHGADKAYLFAGSRKRFAEALLALFRDRDLRLSLSAAGRAFAAKFAAPEEVAHAFLQILQLYGGSKLKIRKE